MYLSKVVGIRGTEPMQEEQYKQDDQDIFDYFLCDMYLKKIKNVINSRY